MNVLQKSLIEFELPAWLDKTKSSEDLTVDDVKILMETDDLQLLGSVANDIRRTEVGEVVTFIPNLILNYTNICIVRCHFCAFYRDIGNMEGYALDANQAAERTAEAERVMGTRQVLIQGGVNPDFPLEYYENLFRTIKSRTSKVAIHGLSTCEIEFISRKERSSITEVLSRLREAGLDSLPGAGAEILVDSVRKKLGRNLSSSDGWMNVHEAAHKIGIRSSATMMYGHLETPAEAAEHFIKIRDLQKRTKGFMAFIPWHFEPGNTKLQKDASVTYAAGGLALLRHIAVARIVYSGLIRNIQSSWLTAGIGMAQLALQYGANDWGGTINDEEVIPATGKLVGGLPSRDIIMAVKQIGRAPAMRDNFYNIIEHY